MTLSATSANINAGNNFVTELHLNSGNQKVSAYGVTITYDASVIAINAAIGNSGVEAGANGFVSAINNTTPGKIIISGFDTNGTGPGTDLTIVRINWTALSGGNASMQMVIMSLIDNLLATIGTPKATVAVITIIGPTVTRTATRTATQTITASPVPTPAPTPTAAPTANFSIIEAESYTSQSGIQNETCSEGGQDIGYIENNDYVVYNNINFGSGAKGFLVRVATANSGGNIEIRLDSLTGTLVGTCAVTSTGDWQTWVTKTCLVSGASGTHNLYLKFTGGSGYLFNINWFQFTSGSVATATPIPTATPVPTITYVRFRNVATGLYIDGMGLTTNGANAGQWGDSNSNAQQWQIINAGGYLKFQNRLTGLYLDGMGRTTNGALCGQWAFSNSNNQQWIQEAAGNNVRFKNRASGLYLDGMGSTPFGSDLGQWGNSNSAAQQWQIQ